MKSVKKIIPLIETLANYSIKKFRSDLIAGLTVATLLIPQGMAYALLAGMPPIYGLYTGMVPLVIYAIFGTSRQLSIGPVAISALLILSGVSAVAEPGSTQFISLVIAAGLLIGAFKLILSFLRLGFLVNFISRPVLTGFTSAAAVIILASQLKDALGIQMPRFEFITENFIYAIQHILESNWITGVICFIAILIMLLFKRFLKNFPSGLLVAILGAVIVYLFNLERFDVQIIGEIPKGLPAFKLPILNLEIIKSLLPTVLTVTTIGIVECISIAKVLEAKDKTYSIDPNQELFALGISKIISSFFQSIPASGSFTRSAINFDSGAKTTMATMFTALAMGLSLMFLTPMFYYLPKAVLAAIILVAVIGLFDVKEARNLWKTHKRDFVLMLVTFFATLIFGIEEGVLFGVVLSISLVLIKSSKPHLAILGNIPNTIYYRNINRFPEAKEENNTIILRFDDQLYFANAVYLKDKIYELISDDKYKNLKYLLIDASSIHDIDSTGIHMLHDLDDYLKSRNIELHLCGVTGPARDMLYKNSMMSEPEKHHMSVHEAVLEIHYNKDNPLTNSKSVQTNVSKSIE